MPELRDTFGRHIDYLRVSVTDRCNLRCVYCMPAEGVPWKPHADMLTYEEIARVVAVAAELGVRRVRLTGGEPLVRKNLPALVRELAGTPGIDEVSLTTNGLLLDTLAAPLAEAGLKRVNVSLDTLDPERFRKLTRGGDIARVWRGIQAAEAAGLTPIKLNAVVVRGVNDDELADLARLTSAHPWHIRFIELMPLVDSAGWGDDFPGTGSRYFPVQEMHARLESLGLEPAEGPRGNGPAQIFRLPGALATVGFIAPVGEHFCATCNRLRLTADGYLRACLLHEREIGIREELRTGEDLRPYLQAAVNAKPAGHELAERHTPSGRRMAQIGG